MAKASLALMKLAALLSLLGFYSASAGDSICRMNEKGFLACLPCVSGASPATSVAPSDKCCGALAQADLSCLCKYKDSPLLQQMGIKPDLAKQLPTKCKLSIPAECI